MNLLWYNGNEVRPGTSIGNRLILFDIDIDFRPSSYGLTAWTIRLID